jgi:hypothetical protein
MALWTMFVEVGEFRYSTQVTAADARGAIRKLLGTGGVKKAIANLYPDNWPNSYSMRDVVALLPMEGLVNMYLCQLGREGKYVSVVMARTVSRKYA